MKNFLIQSDYGTELESDLEEMTSILLGNNDEGIFFAPGRTVTRGTNKKPSATEVLIDSTSRYEKQSYDTWRSMERSCKSDASANALFSAFYSRFNELWPEGDSLLGLDTESLGKLVYNAIALICIGHSNYTTDTTCLSVEGKDRLIRQILTLQLDFRVERDMFNYPSWYELAAPISIIKDAGGNPIRAENRKLLGEEFEAIVNMVKNSPDGMGKAMYSGIYNKYLG